MDSSQAPRESSGRWLRRLASAEFSRLMGASIESVLVQRASLPAAEARRLRWEALRRFAGLLATRTRRVRALTRSECLRELERTHGALLRRRARQDTELARLTQELGAARAAATEAVLTQAEETALAAALRADLTALLASGASELEPVLERERMRRAAALAGAVARERERIDLLERRLAKLRVAQGEMERALLELARRAELDHGLPSIYRAVQGLDENAGEREVKVELLRRIYEQNMALQRRGA